MEYVLLAVVGLVAGVLGGLLGIGGSSVMLPAMIWILGRYNEQGTNQIHQYMAAAMIVNFLLIIPSVLPHVRNRAVWAGVWRWMAPAAVVGILLGVQLSYRFRTESTKTYLGWGVGVFFVYVIVNNVRRLFAERHGEGLSRAQVEGQPAWRKLLIGLPMGILAGMLGIGGGSLAVPAQQIALKMPLRNAIATSAATIMTISWVGAIAKNAQIEAQGQGTGGRSLLLAACLAPLAMIGSYFGGHLTHKLPLRAVRMAFIGIMVLAALKMFLPGHKPQDRRAAPPSGIAPASAPSVPAVGASTRPAAAP